MSKQRREKVLQTEGMEICKGPEKRKYSQLIIVNHVWICELRTREANRVSLDRFQTMSSWK